MPPSARRPSGVSPLLPSTVLALLLAPAALEARGFRPGLLPNGFRYACANCHVDPGGGGPRNAFGRDVERLVTPNGRESFWGPALAALDSDGDDRSNGVELGDPEGAWAPGDPGPGDPAAVTNPGVSDTPDPPPPPTAVEFLRGDSDDSGTVDLSDAVGLLVHLFGGAAPPPCADAADGNGDGRLDLTDAVTILVFLFAQGAAPPAPFPECAALPADASSLGCESFTSCGVAPPPPPDGGTGRRVRIEALVEEVTATGVRLLGLGVEIPAGADLEDDSDLRAEPFLREHILVGDWLEIRGTNHSGHDVTAHRVERDEARGRVALLGPPVLDSATGTLTILGVEVTLSAATVFQDLDRSELGREAFVEQALADDLLVEAKGFWSAGSIQATELELEEEFDD